MKGLRKTTDSVSLDLIEPNFYLGNLAAATDLSTLRKYSITHILTINTSPLPREIADLKNVSTKFIQLPDFPKEDLLSHLDDTKEFIDEGIAHGTVLVHCYYGISRSATVVIAYIMQKYKQSYSEAFKRVKHKRLIVCPNKGFISQLRLYSEMGYKIDKTRMKYKLYRLELVAEKMKNSKSLPQDFIDLVKIAPSRNQLQSTSNVLRCNNCRCILASESNLITHKNSRNTTCSKMCFIEPMSWMVGVTQFTQGKLKCPTCRISLGSFSWIKGYICLCGCHVSPAFYFTPSKTHLINVFRNVMLPHCTL